MKIAQLKKMAQTGQFGYAPLILSLIERIEAFEGDVQYFVDRCEGKHSDGPIQSRRTYGRFKNTLIHYGSTAELTEPSENSWKCPAHADYPPTGPCECEKVVTQ